jgi:tetratricopeptide (TPR) repeat protein
MSMRFEIRLASILLLVVAAASCRSRPDPAPAPEVLDPASAAVQRAHALAARDLDRAALDEFERAIAINPTLTIAYMGAADIYREQGDHASAEARYARAASLEPRNFDAQYYHALTLQLLDRLAEAIRAYLRALALRPADVSANLNLATAYLQAGEPGQALPYAERAVFLDPASGPSRVNLGAVLSALGRHEDAVLEYRQAAELMDLTPELLLNLAEALGRTARYEEMRHTLERLIDMAPSALAHERLGSAMFHLGDFDAALHHFELALSRDESHYPALNGVGVCRLNRYLLSGKSDIESLDVAVDAFRRSLRLRPDQPRIKELLSRYR